MELPRGTYVGNVGKCPIPTGIGGNDGLCVGDWPKPDRDLTDEGQTIRPGAPTTITPKIRPKTCVILVRDSESWLVVVSVFST